MMIAVSFFTSHHSLEPVKMTAAIATKNASIKVIYRYRHKHSTLRHNTIKIFHTCTCTCMYMYMYMYMYIMHNPVHVATHMHKQNRL